MKMQLNVMHWCSVLYWLLIYAIYSDSLLTHINIKNENYWGGLGMGRVWCDWVIDRGPIRLR
jgi:hypothetical protein